MPQTPGYRGGSHRAPRAVRPFGRRAGILPPGNTGRAQAPGGAAREIAAFEGSGCRSSHRMYPPTALQQRLTAAPAWYGKCHRLECSLAITLRCRELHGKASAAPCTRSHGRRGRPPAGAASGSAKRATQYGLTPPSYGPLGYSGNRTSNRAGLARSRGGCLGSRAPCYCFGHDDGWMALFPLLWSAVSRISWRGRHGHRIGCMGGGRVLALPSRAGTHCFPPHSVLWYRTGCRGAASSYRLRCFAGVLAM